MEEKLNLSKFTIVGLRYSLEFQKCRLCVEYLYRNQAKKFEKPEIQPMFDLEWQEYIIRMRRQYGGKWWKLKKPVAIIYNGEYLGSDEIFYRYTSAENLLQIRNFDEYVMDDIENYVETKNLKGRKFVYITVKIDRKAIGAMLFELYSEDLPITCKNFLTRCRGDYRGAPVHRIVKNGWIQCGGWNIKHKKMPCENYYYLHDKRGILSMCNNGRHRSNSTQFFITLTSTPWMNYRYVAFGQLIQGAEILDKLEQITTYYQVPQCDIRMNHAGEYLLCQNEPYEKYLLQTHDKPGLSHKNDTWDRESIMKESRFNLGSYSLPTDRQSYYPTVMDYMTSHTDIFEENDDDSSVHEKNHNIVDISRAFYLNVPSFIHSHLFTSYSNDHHISIQTNQL